MVRSGAAKRSHLPVDELRLFLVTKTTKNLDGKGGRVDSVFIERLWRSLSYERLPLWSDRNIPELCEHADTRIKYYNHNRNHQVLDYATLWSLYRPEQEVKAD